MLSPVQLTPLPLVRFRMFMVHEPATPVGVGPVESLPPPQPDTSTRPSTSTPPRSDRMRVSHRRDDQGRNELWLRGRAVRRRRLQLRLHPLEQRHEVLPVLVNLLLSLLL